MRIVATWNLRPGTDPAAFEAWLIGEAAPAIRALPSVDDLQFYRATDAFGGEAAAPFHYVELLDVIDPEGFGRDIAGESVAAITARLREETENMAVANTEELSLARAPTPA